MPSFLQVSLLETHQRQKKPKRLLKAFFFFFLLETERQTKQHLTATTTLFCGSGSLLKNITKTCQLGTFQTNKEELEKLKPRLSDRNTKAAYNRVH